MFRNETEAIPNRRDIFVNGRLKVFNTINEFNQLDKNKLLDELGLNVCFEFSCEALFLTKFFSIFKIWSDITSGKALENPELLTKFCLITFAVSIINIFSLNFKYFNLFLKKRI
jgi:hypothetical protein